MSQTAREIMMAKAAALRAKQAETKVTQEEDVTTPAQTEVKKSIPGLDKAVEKRVEKEQVEETKKAKKEEDKPEASKVVKSTLKGLFKNKDLIESIGKEQTGSYTEIPDGIYDAKIAGVEFTTTEKEDSMIVFDVLVNGIVTVETKNHEAAEEFVGEITKIYIAFGEAEDKDEDWKERNAQLMLTYLQRFGADVSSPDKVTETYEDVIGKKLKLEVITKTSKKSGKTNTNKYMHEVSWTAKK